ncbi:MAG: FkbM family methyltransferase [Deltaproteobacteria bacterium]|nr:FkbM family methyltransferase [Deltaproteobacteria bacterium]
MPAFNLNFFSDRLQSMQEEVFFIQIGAMDGKTQDPIYDLVRSRGWRGILVEPMKDHFEKLKENYAGCEGLIFENIAIAEHTGAGTMYRIPAQTVHDKKLPRWGLQASSFFPDRNALAWDGIRPHVIQETVDCLSLPDLLAKHHVKDVHVLQLDAEGYDYRILRQLDFKRFKPYIINLEIVNMTLSELGHCKQLLDKHQYLYSKTGYDLLAVSLQF